MGHSVISSEDTKVSSTAAMMPPTYDPPPPSFADTPVPSQDALFNLATRLSNDEKLQMDLALRNSLKDVGPFKQSVFTPNGEHINSLRTSRRLFQEADKRELQKKTTAYSSQKKKARSSPPEVITLDNTPPSTMNRIHNNHLDPAYFAMTQTDTLPSPSYFKTNVDSKWKQKIRHEVIRYMQNGENDSIKQHARELYRIMTRQEPREKFSDIDNMACDCSNAGMSATETVELMLSMI